MKMLYLLEGLDGTGKTTLADALERRIGNATTIKLDTTRNHNDWIDDWTVATALVAALPLAHDIILDRSILSGLAYARDMTMERRLQIWGEYLSLFHGERMTLVHLVAQDAVRIARDPDGFQSVPATLDFNAWIVAASRASEGRVRYDCINSGLMELEAIANRLMAPTTRHMVVVKPFANGWVSLMFPQTGGYSAIARNDWTAIFGGLKRKWNVSHLPAKHPDGYWAIHPNALAIRGSAERLAEDIIEAYAERGYAIEARVVPTELAFTGEVYLR